MATTKFVAITPLIPLTIFVLFILIALLSFMRNYFLQPSNIRRWSAGAQITTVGVEQLAV